jgi:hypothetical protein
MVDGFVSTRTLRALSPTHNNCFAEAEDDKNAQGYRYAISKRGTAQCADSRSQLRGVARRHCEGSAIISRVARAHLEGLRELGLA